MLKVGLTGGIGSGKTVVSKIFQSFGIPVYNADNSAKEIVHHSAQVQSEIVDLLGPDAFINGNYNRTYVASIVFKDPEKLSALNKIIHPAVQQHFGEWLLVQSSPYIVKEAALLFEAGSYKSLDKIITVCAPTDLRIERIKSRDHANESDIQKRISSQLSDEEKIKLSDFVIKNDERSLVIDQVLYIHQALLSVK